MAVMAKSVAVEQEGLGKAPEKQEAKVSSAVELESIGGFSLLEALIDGVQNLNPERKARRDIFLQEGGKKAERTALKKKMGEWISLLKGASSTAEIVEQGNIKLQSAEKNLKENLKRALDSTRELEQSYRSVSLFYKNTEQDKLKNISIVNASMDQLTDLDNPRFIEKIAKELKQSFDRLDLRKNYSLLVVPGYLGSNKVVERWAKMAYDNKVMLVTDFQHFDRPDDAMEVFESANLAGGDAYRANVMMACNWLVGRSKTDWVNEEEDLFVPPSAALAGRLYSTLMSQITAGKKYGGINEVDATAFDLTKSELSQLERMGLIPMVQEYGKVMAFSGKTLFNGDNIGLQTYSVVRVFDYITKVLFDFLNRRAFENWDTSVELDVKDQIVNYLNTVTGNGRLIEYFNIMKLERDEDQKDRILLDIHITPFFPAKSFVLKLDGYKGEDESVTWKSDVQQKGDA
jgi:hypothetical protein